MPSDWIKMRTDLYRDPKVCKIADILLDPDGPLASYVSQNCQRDMTVTRNVTRNVTVGALVTLWGVTRHRGKRYEDDLVLRKIDADVIDDIVDIPGFGEAMLAVGWAEVRGGDLVFPRFFEEFNTEPSEDTKQKAAERQRRFREKRNALRNVTVTSRSNTEESRVEKSRVEKKKKKETNKESWADDFHFDDFWTAYPTRKGKRLGKKQSMEFWKKMSDEQRQAAIVGVKHYGEWCRRTDTYPKDPIRFLRDETYLEFAEPANPNQEADDEWQRIYDSAFTMADLSPEERAAWEIECARRQGRPVPSDNGESEPDVAF